MVDKYENPFAKISAMIGGDEYLKVSRSLLKSEDATDEEIASSTGLRINMVRKVLYDPVSYTHLPLPTIYSL